MAKIGILHGKLLIVIPIKQLLLGILPNDEENSFTADDWKQSYE